MTRTRDAPAVAPDHVQGGSGGPAALELTDLHRCFGSVRAVDGISLTVAPGEVVALLGPNGAGKSTTVDMILGLTRPDRGSVRLFGQDPSEAVVAGVVGAMLQTGALLPDVTVGQLVSTIAGLQRRPADPAAALRRAGITDLARRSTNRLSGGQVQRVRYAMAIVADPDVLLLDEPTVAMDVTTRRSFWARMRDYTAAGKTVVFATHYLAEADAYADRVVLMRAGRIVADGTAAEIKNSVSGRIVSFAGASGASGGSGGSGGEHLDELPGVTAVERRGDRVLLRSADSDTTLRAVLAEIPGAHDLEVTGVDLEDAFLALTGTTDPTDTTDITDITDPADDTDDTDDTGPGGHR